MRHFSPLVAFLIFILSFLAFKANATHIVGGEMNYVYLGSNNYEIHLNIYRDCLSGQAPYDDPASVGVFDASGNLLQSLSLPYLGSDTLVPEVNYHCTITIPTNICVEVTTYIFVVNLPPINGGYRLEYQRCCRNGSILNIVNPGATGETFVATIPDASLYGTNSNPSFNYWPPVLICESLPIAVDLSATDIDGDSLVYNLCTPYEGADSFNPMPTPPSFTPLNLLTWMNPPYSLSNILGGSQPLSINSSTGLLTGNTSILGCFVVGVCVEEYRNGVLISETKRDFQFNVVNCNLTVISAFTVPTTLCGGVANFANFSTGATHYHWDFGDISNPGDTSNLTNPSYTYTTPGTYTVTLIAADALCADTNEVIINVFLNPVITVNPSNPVICPNSSVDLTASGASTYTWAGPALSASTGTTVTASPTSTSTYSITGTDVNGCSGTTTFTITVQPTIPATINTNATGCLSNTGSATAMPSGLNYIWSNSEITQTIYNLPQGTYTVTVSNNNGCSGTATGTVLVQPEYQLQTSATEDLCGHDNGTATVNATGSPGPFTYLWSNGATTSSITNLSSGVYTVTVYEGICAVTTVVNVPYNPGAAHADFVALPETMYIEDNSTCTIMDYSLNAVQWEWNFGDGTFATGVVSSHTFADIGTYTIILIVTDSNGCKDTASHMVKVKQPFSIYIPNSFSPNGDGMNDVFGPTGLNIDLSNYEMSIYNRWGEQIYRTWDISKPWNGRTNNKDDKVQIGIYVYSIFAREIDGKEHQYIGTVMVLR